MKSAYIRQLKNMKSAYIRQLKNMKSSYISRLKIFGIIGDQLQRQGQTNMETMKLSHSSF
jgi:hypothetical protein